MRTLLVLAFVAVAAALVARPYTPVPEEWVESGLPSPRQPLTLTIALKQKTSAKELDAVLKRIATPGSPDYGKWLSHEQVVEMTAPSTKDMETVVSFLVENQMAFEVSKSQRDIIVTTTVEKAERLFKVQFKSFTKAETSQTAVRAVGAAYLPEDVNAKIQAIFGLHGLPIPPRAAKLVDVNAPNMQPAVTPDVLRSVYKITGKGSKSTKNVQAVAEFQGQYANQTDLNDFFRRFVPSAPASDAQIYKYIGQHKTGEGVEALLDVEYIMGVAPGVLTEFYEYPGMDFCGDLKMWTTNLMGKTPGVDGPQVTSVSYGWQGDTTRIGCSASDKSTVDEDLQKLAMKGFTIIFASGDSGAGLQGDKLWGSWPAGSPYVTAVGATRFITTTTGGEEATDQFGSGGGFSRTFTAPTWQKAAIEQYFKELPESEKPPASYYPAGGRGTPDVAAQGENFQVVTRGIVTGVGGTSAAAPTFAAVISLLNEIRVSQGKSALGYINEWIYQNPTVFNDITMGTNKHGRGPFPLKYGWACEKGWDPVTGWGTPIFDKMVQALP